MKRKTGKISGLIIMLLTIMLGHVQVIKAQIICDISIDTPMPVCPDTYFELSVFQEENQTFNWQIKQGESFVSIGDESILGISIVDSSVFRVIVIDTIELDTCPSDLFSVSVRPEINIEFNQLQLTCTNGDNDNGNSAKVRATATGAFESDEYHYFWDVPPLNIAPGDSSLALDLKAHQYYSITVMDNYGCPKTEEFWTEAFDNPEVEIIVDSALTFIQNPFVTYSFVNLSSDSMMITNHFWWFQDSIPDPDYTNTSDELSPTYEYESLSPPDGYITTLTVYNEEGCDTLYSTFVDIKPIKLKIPNVFTPNGDGKNDKFVVTNDTEDENERVFEDALERFYESSRLVIFNRAGRTVFKADNYDNNWDGDNLPDGVYYFVLECNGAISNDVFKGSVTIIRGD